MIDFKNWNQASLSFKLPITSLRVGLTSYIRQADQVMSTQLESVTQQVDQQGHRIEKLNNDLVSQVGGLQAGLTSVQQDVSNGFTRMEALLEKRAKTS